MSTMKPNEAVHKGTSLIGQLLIMAGIFECTFSEVIETCITEHFDVACPSSAVIFVKSAEFGRMEVGRCITEEDEFLGCSNDVLPLLDDWCSGRQECSFEVTNEHLEAANRNCLKILIKYLKVEYTCLEVKTRCSPNKQNIVYDEPGYISSTALDKNGCGSTRSPWHISADPGQIIQLDMIDFGAKSHKYGLVSCGTVYGFIVERSLGINHTICAGSSRQTALYLSKTNSIEIYIMPRNVRENARILIQYSVTGCPEIKRPANAWYKREGDEAVIGCENNDKEWRLTCVDNKWVGDVGNCTQLAKVVKEEKEHQSVLHISSIVVISGIAGIAVVLSVIAVVSGVVYINQYRMKQEMKRANLYKTYSKIGSNVQAYYRPVTVDQSENNATSWDMSLLPANQMTLLSEKCTCPTLQMRNQGAGDKTEGDRSLESQSLYSSIRST